MNFGAKTLRQVIQENRNYTAQAVCDFQTDRRFRLHTRFDLYRLWLASARASRDIPAADLDATIDEVLSRKQET